MASVGVHLVIGKEFLKRNKIKREKDFLRGCVAPDIARDRTKAHFSNKRIASSYTDAIINKVDLKKFVSSHTLESDYFKGYFLHLLTDYIFYKKYLLNWDRYKKIENKLSYIEIKNIIYLDYNKINSWLYSNYDISATELPEIANGIHDGKCDVLTTGLIKKVIKECSMCDLNKIYDEIKNNSSCWI